MNTLHQLKLPIELFAVLTEHAPALSGKLQAWYDFYQPATPGECALLDMAVMARVQQERVYACLTEMVDQDVRTAVLKYDCDQEDEVQRYRDMFETNPGAAMVGLQRSALGVRFLIARWERLLGLIQREGTLFGNDRNEAIHYQGARATKPENLFESEGAYMTWLYCLMCQPKPRDQDLINIGAERFMPEALNDRPIHHWTGLVPHCRQLLVDLAQRELTFLRPREKTLRDTYETPARDGAETRKQVLEGPIGMRLRQELDAQERNFHRAYGAFLKGRAYTEKSGRLPGVPDPDLHGVSVVTVAPAYDRSAVAKAKAERKAPADALAPGGANGIGARMPRGDIERASVLATNPMSVEEFAEFQRKVAEEDARAGGGNPSVRVGRYV